MVWYGRYGMYGRHMAGVVWQVQVGRWQVAGGVVAGMVAGTAGSRKVAGGRWQAGPNEKRSYMKTMLETQ